MFKRTFLILLIFTLAPLVILTTAYYFYHVSVVNGELNTGFTGHLQNADYIISKTIEDKSIDVMSWAKTSIPEVCFEYDRPEAMEVFLNGLINTYGIYSHIIAFRSDLSLFAVDSATLNMATTFSLSNKEREQIVDIPSQTLVEISNRDGANYIVFTTVVKDQIGDIIGYLSAYMNWKVIGELVHQQNNISLAPNLQFSKLFYDKDLNPINESAKSLTDSAIILAALNKAGKINSYKSYPHEYIIACIKSERVLTNGALIECMRVKKDDLFAPLGFVRNIATIIGLISLIVVIFITIVLTRKVLSPFKEIATILTKYKRVESNDKADNKYSNNIDSLKDNIVRLINQLIESERKIRDTAHLAAIGETTTMVAHDVRKPLASMKALLKMLPNIKDNPDQLNKMMANVDHNIERTNTMLNDILEFSRDSTALELRNHDPQSVVTSALSDALRNHPDSDVSIEYDLKHKDSLHVDGDRIIRVLTNIIDNALDAMSNGSDSAVGKIWIKTFGQCTNQESQITVVIGNDGPAIPQDVLDKIFDPFFTHGKKGGTGLGLSICQKIVQMHGGSIKAESDEGGGRRDEGRSSTEFIIELPAREGHLMVNESELIYHSSELKAFHEEEKARVDYGDTANTAEFMRINKERGRLSHLLIVDDEPLFRETVRTLLNGLSQVKDHIRVVEADSAEMVLKLFNDRVFDYVVADIDLGKRRMNGYEFAQIILEKYPDTYVLIHSNKRKDELDKNIRQVASERFMGFLPKPMRSSELLQFLACKSFESKKEVSKPVRKSILVVNDDEGINLSMKLSLKSDNVQVLDATNVSDALVHLAASNVDIVLADINLGENMPDGYDLLKKIKEQGKNVPFYFMSGYSKTDQWPKAKDMGANGYLQLPVDTDEIKRILRI